ncbi:MAG: VOC family protein [Candidatus Thorarchaeota archaeon]|jgi:predicted enzyme related to lactoylglutathione lyase
MSVRGIGGVFFRSKNPKTLQKWYEEKLGLKPDEGGYIYFMWKDLKAPGYTLWAPFPEDTNYFGESGADSMINFVVSDIEQFFESLKEKGVKVDERGIEMTEQGRFAWIFDPEGNKIELWEPAEEK